MRTSLAQQITIWMGILFFSLGILGALYFFVKFDVSAGRSVANLDLLNQRTNGIMLSCTSIIAGSMFMLMAGIQGSPAHD